MSLLRPGRTLGGDVQDIRPNAEVIEDIEERPNRPVPRGELGSRKPICSRQEPSGEHPICQRLTWVRDDRREFTIVEFRERLPQTSESGVEIGDHDDVAAVPTFGRPAHHIDEGRSYSPFTTLLSPPCRSTRDPEDSGDQREVGDPDVFQRDHDEATPQAVGRPLDEDLNRCSGRSTITTTDRFLERRRCEPGIGQYSPLLYSMLAPLRDEIDDVTFYYHRITPCLQGLFYHIELLRRHF